MATRRCPVAPVALAVAALAAATLWPAPARAAPVFVVIGQVAPDGDSLGGGGCTLCNAVQYDSVATTNPSYALPYDGVITRWSVRTGATINSAPEWARARTFRRVDATTSTLISQGAQGPLTTTTTTHTFWDRIAATAGDVLGAQFHSGAFIDETVPIYADTTAAGDIGARVDENPGPGIGGNTTGTGFAHRRVNVSARLEHDTDLDGYGDGSQDLCSDDAGHAVTACSGTLFGSDLQGPYKRVGFSCGFACARVQLTTGGGATTAASADGVVVRWRLQAPLAGSYRVRILRPAAGGGYTFGSASDPVTIGADEALSTFAARLAIPAGGYVALVPPGFVVQPSLVSPPAGATFSTFNDGAEGAPAAFAAGIAGVVLYDADVEPDADHDGYGDVTQDACPSDATTQGACPPSTPPPAPATSQPPPAVTPGAATVTALALRYSRFRVAHSGAVVARRPHAGTALRVTLSAPAQVRFRVRRLAAGVRRGGACRAPTAKTRGLRRCTRAVLAHAFTRTLQAGLTSTPYSGRYRRNGRTRTLTPGHYRLDAAVVAPSGSVGAATARTFTVLR